MAFHYYLLFFGWYHAWRVSGGQRGGARGTVLTCLLHLTTRQLLIVSPHAASQMSAGPVSASISARCISGSWRELFSTCL